MFRGNWIRIIIRWLQLETEEAKRIGQAWLERTTTLVVVFLAVETLGLILPSFFTGLGLVINIFLGLTLLYRAWAATVVLDVGQNLARQAAADADQGPEIQTMKVVGTVLGIVGLFLLLLLIGTYGDFPQGTYFPWLTVRVVALFLLAMGAPQGTTAAQGMGKVLMLGDHIFLLFWVSFFGMTTPYGPYLIHQTDRTLALGITQYPSRPGKEIVLDTAQTYGNDNATADRATIPTHSSKKPWNFETATRIVDRAGGHAYEAEEIKARGLAKAEGRTLPADGIYVSALQPSWKLAKNKANQPIRVSKGELITGSGEVASDYLSQPVGPNGIAMVPAEIAVFRPFAGMDKCQPFSLCGVVKDENNREYKFQIGESAIAPASGQLWLIVNVPSRGPYGLDEEMFDRHSSRGFEVHTGGNNKEATSK